MDTKYIQKVVGQVNGVDLLVLEPIVERPEPSFTGLKQLRSISLYEEIFEGKDPRAACCESCSMFCVCKEEFDDQLLEQNLEGEIDDDEYFHTEFDTQGVCDNYSREGQTVYDEVFGETMN